tara:strand:- start:10155 stop:10403 length:249 start_codon:yes stop_codon:yes gene_type:complete
MLQQNQLKTQVKVLVKMVTRGIVVQVVAPLEKVLNKHALMVNGGAAQSSTAQVKGYVATFTLAKTEKCTYTKAAGLQEVANK